MTLLTLLRNSAGGGGGGSIQLEGTPTLYENASSTDAVVPYPSGIVSGELLLIHVTNSGASVPSTPAGWTLAKSQANANGTACSIMTAYKVATGSESGSVTVATNVAAGRVTGMMERFSGVDTTTPMDVAASSANGATGASWSVPSITTVTNGAMLVAHTALNASSSADITHTAGTMTSINASTGTGRRTRIWTETDATAGATGTRTFESNPTTTLQWTVALIALRPGAGGATPTLVQRVVGITETPSTTGVVSVKTTDAESVRLKLGTDSGLTTGVVFGDAVTPSANGDARLTVSGLTANTNYYYRVAMTPTGGGTEELDDAATVGRLRTAPTGQANFAFNFGSCTNGTDSASMSAIATRADDLFFHLGDMYYADGSGTTTANFRTKMNEKITAANHAAVFAVTPMTYTPSDHDGMNNNTEAGTDATPWANWNTVKDELFPMPDNYYTFVWGRVRFIQTDTRSFKSPAANTDNSSKTALGTTQKQWVKDTITASAEQVIVIIQADPWIGSAVAGDDGWFGYTTERTEMANFYAASKKRIVLLAGDMHAVAADDGTNAPGGVAVFHGAPLNNNASIKGGPYSAGPYPSSGTAVVQQYGRCVVTDTGTEIELAYTGYSSDNTVRVTTTIQHYLGDKADPVGITDAATIEQGRNPADPVGATDAATIELGKTVSDTAGITDSVTIELGKEANPADPVGLLDAVDVVQSNERTQPDPVGITDAATVEQANERTQPDAVGLLDAATIEQGRTQPDPVGITDSVTAELTPGLALDASTTTVKRSATTAVTSDSFTPPVDSILLVVTHASGDVPSNPTVAITNSGSGVSSWTLVDRATVTTTSGSGGGGVLSMHWAKVNTSAAMTVTSTQTNGSTPTWQKVWVILGADLSNPIGANTKGASLLNTLTSTAITTTRANSWLLMGATEWTAPVNAPTSPDLDIGFSPFSDQGAANILGGASGAKLVVTSGSSVTGTIDGAGTAARDWLYVATEILPATGGTNKSVADAVGLLDAASAVQDNARTQPDAVGLLDSATASVGFDRNVSDTAGITDAASAVLDMATTQADPVGLTDSVTVEFTGVVNKQADDTLGLTDAVSFETIMERQPADPEGITDAASPTQGLDRNVTDTAGISDALDLARAMFVSLGEPIGITDSASASLVGDTFANVADPEGITDATSVQVIQNIDYADIANLSDSASFTTTLDRHQQDAVPIAEALEAVQDAIRTLSENLSAQDEATKLFDVVRPPSDSAGVADAVTVTIELVREVNDLAGLSDAVQTVMTRFATFAENVGITDSVTAVLGSQLKDYALRAVPLATRWTIAALETRWSYITEAERFIADELDATYQKIPLADRWTVEPLPGESMATVDILVSAGAAKYVGGTVIEKTGKNISGATFQISLGSEFQPGRTWLAPDVSIAGDNNSERIVKYLVTASTPSGLVVPGTYWAWVRVTDTPEIEPLRVQGPINVR